MAKRAKTTIPQTTAPKPLPIPTTQWKAAFARMKHPRETGLYYSKERAEWVHSGYTVWTLEEWRLTFAARGGRTTVVNSDDFRQSVDSEGRHWEFFGYTIPLYDE